MHMHTHVDRLCDLHVVRMCMMCCAHVVSSRSKREQVDAQHDLLTHLRTKKEMYETLLQQHIQSREERTTRQ